MSLSHKLIIADSFNPDISEQVVLIQGTDHGLPCTKPASLMTGGDSWRGSHPSLQVLWLKALMPSLECLCLFFFCLWRQGFTVLSELSGLVLNSGFSCFRLLNSELGHQMGTNIPSLFIGLDAVLFFFLVILRVCMWCIYRQAHHSLCSEIRGQCSGVGSVFPK